MNAVQWPASTAPVSTTRPGRYENSGGPPSREPRRARAASTRPRPTVATQIRAQAMAAPGSGTQRTRTPIDPHELHTPTSTA